MIKSAVDWLKGSAHTLINFFDLADSQREIRGTISTPFVVKSKSKPTSPLPDNEEDLFGHHSHKRYYQYLIDRYQILNMVGTEGSLTLALEDIFVSPHLRLAAHLPADALQLSQLKYLARLRNGSQNIWAYLMLEQKRGFMLLGAPGSGKTCLLKHMTLTLAHPQKRLFSGIPNRFPILLSFNNHHTIINGKPDYSLAEAAHYSLTMGQMVDPLPPSWFEAQLQTGRCLIMLDGLDEIADPIYRENVLIWIKEQIALYNNNCFVITSRLLISHHDQLKEMMSLEIQPFNREEIQQFVTSWYQTNQLAHNEEKVKAFIELCAQAPYLTLSRNPLLLTMMTILYRHGSPLAKDRAKLYEQMCKLALHPTGDREELDLPAAQKQRVLQPLAYYMMRHKLQEVATSEACKVIYVPLDMVSRNPKGMDFLQLVARSSGLLIEHQSGQYSFAHLTFQEYLAAKHILEQRLQHKLINNVEESWWHETTRLYSAMTDVTAIIRASLRKLNPPDSALLLAIRCAKETEHIQPEIYNGLETLLEQQIENLNPIRRRIVAEALLSFRLNRMMPVDQEVSVADSLITNTEYQLFINQQRVKHVKPDQWWHYQYTFRSGKGHEPAVDLRPADAVAFCHWLTEQDEQGREFRLPYTGEFSPLVSDVGYWTQGEMEQEYTLENEQSVILSIDTLQNRLNTVLRIDLACHPEEALERIRDLDRDLTYILDHENKGERAVAVALALVRNFTHDRTHNRTVNLSEALNQFPESRWYANFIAWMVTQKLVTVLRYQPKPRSWLDLFDAKQTLPAINQKEIDMLAEKYFELYVDLSSLEKQVHSKSFTSRGIRVVSYLPIEPRKEMLSSLPTNEAEEIHVPALVTGQKRKVIQKKICLLGDEGVGKTSLVRRCVEGRFDEKYLSTVGVTISRQTLIRPTYTMNLLIWDMEGGQGFKKAQLNYLRGATGALIVCDLTRRETLGAFERYARQLRALNGTVPFVFIGNKIDLKSRTIASTELELLSQTLGGEYLLTSAKTGTQVMQAFELLTDLIEAQHS